MPIDIKELEDIMKKRAAGESSAADNSNTSTVHQPTRISAEDTRAEMLRRAGPEYAAKVEQNTEALYNSYNTNMKSVQDKYGASDYAYTYYKDYKTVNAEYVSNLTKLRTQIDEQRSNLQSAIDSGVYGSDTAAAQTELKNLNDMYDYTEGMIEYIDGDTKSREQYYSDKYDAIENSSAETKSKYGTGGWDRMTEEQRADIVASEYKGDYIFNNASQYYQNRLNYRSYASDSNMVETAEYNRLVTDLFSFVGEGGAIDRLRGVSEGVTDGSTEFDYTEIADLQTYANETLARIEKCKRFFEPDVYNDILDTVRKVSENLPRLLEAKLYFDTEEEKEAIDTMNSDEIGREIIRLESVKDKSSNETEREWLDYIISHAKLQMVGKTDKDRAEVYEQMVSDARTIDSRLSDLKEEIAELNDYKKSLQKMYDYYMSLCRQNGQDPMESSYRDHILKYQATCTQLDDVISVYNDAKATRDKIESDKEYYRMLESMSAEWRAKTASWVERSLSTTMDLITAFGDGVISTTASVLDVIYVANPITFIWESGKGMLFDEEGNFDFDFFRGDAHYKKWADEYLTQGGLRHSDTVESLLGENTSLPRTTTPASYDNQFTDFLKDGARVIGSLVPGITAAIATGGSTAAVQAVTMGTSTFHSSYNAARYNGATIDEATAYAFITGSIAGGSEILIGTPLDQGAGLVGKVIGKSKITNPTLRTAYSKFVTIVGEGLEESAENLLDTGAAYITYDPEATVNWSDVAYEGILGSAVAAVLSGSNIKNEYKVYKEDADHVSELIKRAESISSPAEAQQFVNELAAWCTLLDSAVKEGNFEYKDSAEFLMHNYRAIADSVMQKLPELVATNGDVDAMLDNIVSLVATGESTDGASLASVLAETNIQLYEAMLEKSDLDPEVRAKLEEQYEALKDIRDRYGLIDYSQKTDAQLQKYKGVNSIEHNLDTSTPEGRSNVKTGGIETHTLDLLGSKTKYDEVTAHEVLHQGIKSDEKLLPQIKNIMKSQGIDIEAEAAKYKQAYINQYEQDWYKLNPDAESRMGKDNARDQAYLYAERKYEAEAEEEVAARYFGSVAAELGLGNIVGDNTINRIAAKVGIDGKSRNLSRRILSAVAKYNRVQNAKSKKSQTDTKKKNASDTETGSGKITENMTEIERYELLKDRELTVAVVDADTASKISNDSPELKNNRLKKTYVKPLLKRLGEEFGIFKQYTNPDIEVEFEFGKNNLAESVNKQRGNYDLYAQMISCFDEVVENAVGIEVHNRNQDGYKPDPTLERVYVLCSAFETEDGIVPCKLSVKEFNDKSNRLYVAVALESIKKDRVVSMGVPNNRSHVRTSPVTISISDLFSNVNSKDVDFLKYIPDDFLNDEQRSAKREYLDKVENNSRVDNKNATIDNKNAPSVIESDSSANEKTSNSQTSEKKSDTKTPKMGKGKTADAVYEKGRKLKVGDKVGEVKLVADESGKPVTPVLRASFDRTDVPSYILATVEATGDTALIAELEQETAFMMMGDLTGERAQLTLHDAVEALSEHVRDGDITPEQAAHILSEEYAHPTGADIDTLIDRGNLSAVKYSLVGYTEKGIEVYETSNEIMNKSDKERNKIYLDLVKNNYVGRTARFFKNGHYYYAHLRSDDARKQVYGEKRSSEQGKKALQRTLADGEVFNLLEHSSYDRGALERGKTTKAHKNIKYWDYYIKTVQIDGRVYDLHADVKKSSKEEYVYTLYLKDNHEIKAAPIKRPAKGREKVMETAFDNNTISQIDPVVNNYYMQNSKKDASTDDSISNYHYSIALPDTDTAAAIDREARVKNIVALANSLQDGVQNDAEYAALERVKGNAESIVQKYDELSKLKAELKDVSFSEGPRDTARITELRNEIDSVNRSLNSLERGLSNARTAAPFKDMMQRKVQGSTAKVRHDYYERQKARTESRKNTETKNKTLRQIQKLRNRLANPTKSRNVVNGMQDLASSALTLANAVFSGATNESIAELNIESLSDVEEKALAQYRALVAKRAELQARYGEARAAGEDTSAIEAELETVQGQITEHDRGDLKDMFDRERRGIYKKTSGKLFTELKDAYKALENSGDPNVKATYDPQVYEHLDTLSRQAGDVLVRDMNGTQLEALYRAYKMINHVIAEANQLYVNGRKVEANTLADKIVAEVRARGTSDTKVAIFDDLKRFAVDELKPVYLFRYMGSDTLMECYQNMRRGEETWARDVEEAKQHVADLRSKYGSERWDMKKQHMVRLSGGTMDLTLEQIMTIYAYSNRPQAREHMTVGGFKLLTNEKVKIKREGDGKNSLAKKLKESFVTYYRTEENTHILKDADIDLICREYLDDNQRGYVDEMQRFLSVNMAAKGNEISRTLYGIDLFSEKNYFPIQSARDYVQQSMTPVEASSLKNSGMTKQTVPDANNPIVLRNFHDVWSGHVNNMANYHSFVLGIETMNRILGYNIIGQENYSMESELISAYGNGVNEYIHQLITDVNGGVQSGSGVSGRIMKLFSLYKKSAVAASVSVVVQQPTAIIRAMAYISPKYFNGITKLDYNNRWEELKQWAPIAIIKDVGGFDTSNSGRTAENYIMAREYGTEGSLIERAKDKAKGFFSDADYRDESFMWAAGKADQIGWLAIWEASKAEIADKTKLKGDELLEAAARRFTEVVELTQVYDSVFSRSGYMRDKGDIAKMMTAFMGEPTTSVNMLFDATMNWKADKKQVAKLGAAVLASIVAANLLKSLWIAGRDDDEDESYIDKFLDQFGRNMGSDLFLPNMLPYIRDIISIAEGGDVPRSDTELISNAIAAVKGLFSDTRSGYRKVEDAAGALGAFFGWPVKNVMRDMRTIVNNFKSMFVMPKTTYTTDQIDDALESLEAAAEANGSKISNIHPDRDPPSSFSIKNEKYQLSDDEQDEWYTVRAENATRLYGELLDSVLYDTFSDDDKYKALQLLFSHANYLAKVNYCEKNGIECKDSEHERYIEKMESGYSIAQLVWEKYTFDEPKMKQADKLRAIADSGMSATDQLEHVYQLVTYENDDGELVTAKYDNIKAATDAGAPLSLIASMMTYYDAVEPVKNKNGKTVAYIGTDSKKEKTKTELMEEWLDSTGHEYSGGSMVAITDTMRHYMYAILYPNSKNPFKAK